MSTATLLALDEHKVTDVIMCGLLMVEVTYGITAVRVALYGGPQPRAASDRNSVRTFYRKLRLRSGTANALSWGAQMMLSIKEVASFAAPTEFKRWLLDQGFYEREGDVE